MQRFLIAEEKESGHVKISPCSRSWAFCPDSSPNQKKSPTICIKNLFWAQGAEMFNPAFGPGSEFIISRWKIPLTQNSVFFSPTRITVKNKLFFLVVLCNRFLQVDLFLQRKVPFAQEAQMLLSYSNMSRHSLCHWKCIFTTEIFSNCQSLFQ